MILSLRSIFSENIFRRFVLSLTFLQLTNIYIRRSRVIGQGNIVLRGQCAASEMSRDHLRRRTWPVPRFDGAIQDWRALPRYELPVYG